MLCRRCGGMFDSAPVILEKVVLTVRQDGERKVREAFTELCDECYGTWTSILQFQDRIPEAFARSYGSAMEIPTMPAMDGRTSENDGALRIVPSLPTFASQETAPSGPGLEIIDGGTVDTAQPPQDEPPAPTEAPVAVVDDAADDVPRETATAMRSASPNYIGGRQPPTRRR